MWTNFVGFAGAYIELLIWFCLPAVKIFCWIIHIFDLCWFYVGFKIVVGTAGVTREQSGQLDDRVRGESQEKVWEPQVSTCVKGENGLAGSIATFLLLSCV